MSGGVQCEVSECEKEYIGETSRTLGVRFKEDTDGKHPYSGITEHTSSADHKYTLADAKVLTRKDSDKSQPVLNISGICSPDKADIQIFEVRIRGVGLYIAQRYLSTHKIEFNYPIYVEAVSKRN